MTQETLLKECIELQNKLYDFVLNILNLPSFIQTIQERIFRLENENKELRQLLKKQKQAQNHTDNLLSSLFTYDLGPDIFVAAKKERLAALKYFIEDKGININKQAEKNYDDKLIREGDAALHVASRKGNLQIVQYLLEKGANIEAKVQGFNAGRTPLGLACEKGNLQIVQYLLEKGANIEAKDKDQKTPLHVASLYGRTDVVKYLVSKRAHKTAKNKSGYRPYDYAKNDIIRGLLK